MVDARLNVEVGGATTFTVCDEVPGAQSPEVGVTVKLTL
jgi:hypothetical protein